MDNTVILSTESIKGHIYELRGRKIMIDSDLSMLYGIETKNLKRAVRMNKERFPEDFMFELTKEEYDFLRCNFFTIENGRGKHSKYLPYAFTQEGIAMLSGLLRTPIAIQVNINIMRAFFQMQQALLAMTDTQLQIEQIHSEIRQLRIDMDETLRDQNDINEMVANDQEIIARQLENINDAIAQLQAESTQREINKQRNPIGFIVNK